MADRSRNKFGMTNGVRGDTENVSFWAICEGALRGCPPLEGVASNEVRARGRLSPLL